VELPVKPMSPVNVPRVSIVKSLAMLRVELTYKTETVRGCCTVNDPLDTMLRVPANVPPFVFDTNDAPFTFNTFPLTLVRAPPFQVKRPPLRLNVSKVEISRVPELLRVMSESVQE